MIEHEHPRSDNTITQHPNSHNLRYNEIKRGLTPIDTSPRPDPPDRRSSLSAVAKLRKPNPGNVSSPITATNPTISANAITSGGTTPSKKSRLTARLFRRGDGNQPQDSPTLQQNDSAPKPPSLTNNTTITRTRSKTQGQNQGQSTNTNSGMRSQNHYATASIHEEDKERATPPPIRRSRTGAPTYTPHASYHTTSSLSNRPNSAGGLGSASISNRERHLRRGTFGFGLGGGDGCDDFDLEFCFGFVLLLCCL